MRFKKLALILGALCFTCCVVGCGKKEENKTEETPQETTEVKKLDSMVTKGKVEDQFKKPEKGEEVAVISVQNFGQVKCRLFPEVAPNAVNNFKDFAREGRYNGSTFHRVIKDFMAQAGREADEKGEMKKSQVELNPSVHNFTGALCMARSHSKTQGQGAQFFIVDSESGKNANFDDIKKATDDSFKEEGLDMHVDFDENTKKLYKEHGGKPELDMLYTVFGQVYEGQEVVKKITEVPKKSQEETEPGADKDSVPKDPVVIEKVEIVKV